MKMHKNAKLTPLGRERRVKMMLDGHTPAKAAALAGVFPDQKAQSAIDHLKAALACYRRLGVTVKRVMTDLPAAGR